MKKFFLTVLVIVSACTTKSDKPDDLIPQVQMAALVTEIHLLESKIKKLNIRSMDSAKLVYAHYEKMLFADFNISREQYDQSFSYYEDHTDEYGEIYEIVVDSLMQRQKLLGD